MIHINLIPREHTIARRRKQHIARWGTCIAILSLVAMIPLISGLAAHAQVATLYRNLNLEEQELASVEEQLVHAIATIQEVRGQLEAAKALREKRSWTAMFAMIGTVAPEEIWLTGLATDPVRPQGGASPSRQMSAVARNTTDAQAVERVIIESPRVLVINGFSTSQQACYQLMGELNSTGVFAQVTLGSTTREPIFQGVKLDFDLYRFDMKCEW